MTDIRTMQHTSAYGFGVYTPGSSTACPSQYLPGTSFGLSLTGNSCAGIRADGSSWADSPGFSCHMGVSCSDSCPYLVKAMSVSLVERFVCRLFRIQQITSAAASRPEPITPPTTIPAITPTCIPVDDSFVIGVSVGMLVVLFPLGVVSFVATVPGGTILGGAVLTLGLSAHSSPTLTSRVSVIAFACHMVHVSASKSTMMYAAEKNGH